MSRPHHSSFTRPGTVAWRVVRALLLGGSITRILAYLGEPTQAPHIAPWEKDFEPRQGTGLSEPPPEFEFDQRVIWWALSLLFLPVAAPRLAQAHSRLARRTPPPKTHP